MAGTPDRNPIEPMRLPPTGLDTSDLPNGGVNRAATTYGVPPIAPSILQGVAGLSDALLKDITDQRGVLSPEEASRIANVRAGSYLPADRPSTFRR